MKKISILLLLITLTIIVLALTIYAINNVTETTLSAYGSIFAAAGSFVAVIWFTGSLWYQAKQLKEQRLYFIEESKKRNEDMRRGALLLARDILNDAESRALSINPKLSSIFDIFEDYIMGIEALGTIMSSEDQDEVRKAYLKWINKENVALTIMKGIKSAAEVYFLSIGITDVDYSKDPEEFVYIYGQSLWRLPFFQEFRLATESLTNQMFILKSNRNAANLASLAIMTINGNKDILKKDSTKKMIEEHRKKNYQIPKILEKALRQQNHP